MAIHRILAYLSFGNITETYIYLYTDQLKWNGSWWLLVAIEEVVSIPSFLLMFFIIGNILRYYLFYLPIFSTYVLCMLGPKMYLTIACFSLFFFGVFPIFIHYYKEILDLVLSLSFIIHVCTGLWVEQSYKVKMNRAN